MTGIVTEGLNHWIAYKLNLGCFLYAMGPAIRSITQLRIQTQRMHSSPVEKIATLLCPLAQKCPAVRKLIIVGDIGRPMLKAVGASCCNLSSLELTGVSASAVQQLHLIMPHLTHCCLPSPTATAMPLDGNKAPACCRGILSCITLTHLDIGLYTLTSKLWKALPFALQELTCCLTRKPPSSLRILPNLRRLKLQCHMVNQVNLCDAVAVIRVAPQLEGLELCGEGEASLESSSCIVPHLSVPVFTSNPGSRVSDLVLLHQRVAAGLKVHSTLRGGGSFQGVLLSLLDDTLETGDEDAGGFVASFPPFPAFTGLMLEEFKRGDVSTASKALGAAFPNLTTLVIDLFSSTEQDEVIELENRQLVNLGGCLVLQHLCLEYVKVTPIQLAMLCPRLPFLRSLHLKQCSDFTPVEGELLQSMLRDWGCDVDVSVDFGR